MNWIIFALLGFTSYIAISFMGQITGAEANSGMAAAIRALHPYALVIGIVANVLWAAALYYGLKEGRDAIPMLVAIGVLTTFAYSVLFLRDTVTIFHIVGLVLVLVGVYFLV